MDSVVMPERKVQTLRDAIAVALEGLTGSIPYWMFSRGPERKAMRQHVLQFLDEFTRHRKVIFEMHELEDELDRFLADLKPGKK